MMVLRVRSEMASKLLDSRGEQRNLDFRRAAIVCDSSVVSDNASLASGLKGHQVSYSFPFLLLGIKINRPSLRSKAQRPPLPVVSHRFATRHYPESIAHRARSVGSAAADSLPPTS